MSDSSEPLLVKIGNGDKSAVPDCLDRYGGLVWSMARRLTGSSEDAEDAVQEIFVSLWRSAHRFDPAKSSETTFVALIARRRIIDFLRRRHPAAAADEHLALDEVEDVSDAPESRIDLNEEAQLALREIEALPSAQSKAIKLAVFSGLSHPQIAESLNLPLGTIKSHIRRGLVKVRDRLLHASVSPGGAI